MDEEFKYVCKCGVELPPNHTGPCPVCGESGQFHKAYNKRAHVVYGVNTLGSGTHKPKWSSESLGLFFGFAAIFLAIVIPGILYLLPFCLGINYAILLGFLLIVGVIFWWLRYHILMLIRRFESKFGGERKL